MPETEGSSTRHPIPLFNRPIDNQGRGIHPRNPFGHHYKQEKDEIRPKGKRMPLETIDIKLLIDDGRILNITAHDPQTLPVVIDFWGQMVVIDYNKMEFEKIALQMYTYLESY